MKKILHLKLVFLLIVLLGLQSCLDDSFNFDKVDQTAEVQMSGVFPLVKGTFKLSEVLEEGEELKLIPDETGDNVLTFVYSEPELFEFEVSEFVEIPDQDPITESFTFNPIEIDDFTANGGLSFQELLNVMGEPTKSFIENRDGQSGITYPAYSYNPGVSSPLNGIGNFATVTFANGTLSLTVTNNLPFPIDNASILLINTNTGNLYTTFTFTNIGVGNQQTQDFDLTDQTFDANVEVRLDQISWSTYTNPGTLDIESSEISLELTSSNLEVASGTFDLDFEEDFGYKPLEFDFATETVEQRIHQMKFRNTSIDYTVTSGNTLPVKLYISSSGFYKPNPLDETDKTDTLNYEIDLSSFSNLNGQIPISDYVVDFTGPDGNSSNYLLFHYRLLIEPADDITMDFSEDLEFTVDFDGLNNWEYILGQLGQESIEIDEYNESFDIGDIMDKIDGELKLTNPIINLIYENSIGIPVGLNATLTGSTTEEQVTVDIDDMVRAPINIGETVIDTISINKGNSDIVDLIAMIPENLSFMGAAEINRDDADALNFISYDSRVQFGLDLELPLQLDINQLAYIDTMELDLDSADFEFGGDLKMKLSTKNGFPFNVNVTVYLRDSLDSPLTNLSSAEFPLLSNATIVDGKAQKPSEYSIETITLDNDFIEGLNGTANQLVIYAIIDIPGDEGATIYDSYDFDFKLGLEGSINYVINEND